MSVILDTLKHLKTNGMDDEILSGLKRQFLGALQLQIDDLSFVSEWMAFNLLRMERSVTFEEVEQKVRAISAQSMNKTLKGIICNKGFNFSLLGNESYTPGSGLD
jgi:predicted Zn-dependent peptidase